MLAYVFWHQPKADADSAAYEDAQRAFHEALNSTSACFRVAGLPFAGGRGYEDWYLADDWAGLGCLNDAAVDVIRRGDHDQAAAMAARGWGAVYAIARGSANVPLGVEWRDKPRGEPTNDFLDSLPRGAVWRRQLVLVPAPEFYRSLPISAGRIAIWPVA